MKKHISKLLLFVIITNLIFNFNSFTIKTYASLYTEDYIYWSPEEIDDDNFVAVNKAENTQVNIDIESQSAVLIEGSTGKLIFEKNKDEKLKPASVTKVMTLLLIFEALESNQISLTDEVTVSEHAASMGGSQVFLEPFETQTVDTMIKCISISSANDASVAMADLIAVILAAPDTKTRFREAAKLLNYGFANYSIYFDDIKKELLIFDYIKAPINENDVIGEIKYYYNNNEIGRIKIISINSINEATYKDYFLKLFNKFFIYRN